MGHLFQARYFDSEELRSFGFASVGENVLISEDATIVGVHNVHLASNIRIDSNVVILAKQGILNVGSNVHIEPGSSLVAHYGISIGNFCTISHGVRLFTASADYSGAFFTNVFPSRELQKPKIGQIRLDDHVIIGANSVVMPNVVIGEGAAIGALSFVRHSLENWNIYAGNPLKWISVRNRHIKILGEKILKQESKD